MPPHRVPPFPLSKPSATVVLVDDDAALRTALTFTLELDGFAVRAFASAEDLLGQALPTQSACLVLDQNLTGMTGIDLLTELRARAVALPALLITSQPRRSLRDAAARLKALIVEKPLLTDDLTREIHAALATA